MNIVPGMKIVRKKTFSELINRVEKIERLRKEELIFIQRYSASNFEVLPPSDQMEASEIIKGIAQMHKTVSQLMENNANARWFDSGMAKFNAFVSDKEQVGNVHFYRNLVSELVKYLEANQGALYLIDDPSAADYSLREVAKYAYNRHKKADAVLAKGEGLVGQCLLDKEYIFMTDIPPFYTQITSGLGHATPTSLLITPLMLDDLPIGAIELASFKVFSNREIRFMDAVARVIATAVHNIQQSQQLMSLYQSSQQAQNEVREQEEEIRQQMEELMATNETMVRKTQELEESKRMLEESHNEMQRMKEMEQYIIESKLEAQRSSYELIINKLKNRLQLQQH